MPPTFSIPKKRHSKRGVFGEGRPSKQTAEVVAKIAEAIAMGLNDEEAAAVAGISDMTLVNDVAQKTRSFLIV